MAVSGSAVLILIICFWTVHNASFSKPGAYIPHDATQPLGDITGGSLSDHMELPLELQKAYTTFYIYTAPLPKTCKHSLMCKNGEVTL